MDDDDPDSNIFSRYINKHRSIRKWKSTLDNEKLASITEKTVLKKLKKKQLNQLIGSVYRNKTDEYIFNTHLENEKIGTSIYPFSGFKALPEFVFGNSDKIIYIDHAYNNRNLRKRTRGFEKYDIIPLKHELSNGLPEEAKDDLGLVLLKDSPTIYYEKLHEDIRENIKSNGVISCYKKHPLKEKYIENHNVVSYYLYQTHGNENGLGGYTKPVDYVFDNEQKEEILHMVQRNGLNNLSDLTNWHFFQVDSI